MLVFKRIPDKYYSGTIIFRIHLLDVPFSSVRFLTTRGVADEGYLLYTSADTHVPKCSMQHCMYIVSELSVKCISNPEQI